MMKRGGEDEGEGERAGCVGGEEGRRRLESRGEEEGERVVGVGERRRFVESEDAHFIDNQSR